MYIILGGTGFNEGAVLTRERETTLNTWLLDYPTQWFLVEVWCNGSVCRTDGSTDQL